jgi:heptosyltransferase I
LTKLLIVRLGALGDIVHAIPAVAALRAAFPEAAIDWIVSARHAEILGLLPAVDRCLVIGGPQQGAQRTGAGQKAAAGSGYRAGWRGLTAAIAAMRRNRYDAVIDFQGLLKSAALARASGARRVVGFARRHLRERAAAIFYGESCDPGSAVHVINKNLALAARLGADDRSIAFPLEIPRCRETAIARERLSIGSTDRFVVLNPGAAWPNKRWPAERFGAVASWLLSRRGMRSIVTWGPGEEQLAGDVEAASGGAAVVAPRTSVTALLSIAGESSLFVSGDTGPLHLATAVGTPVVGIFGPTNPARNGPWREADISVSRFEACVCHHERRCRRRECCLLDITVDEVTRAVDSRLAFRPTHG